MARVQIRLPNNYIDALETTSRLLGPTADEVLTAGANVVEPRMRANLVSTIGRATTMPSRSTGQLIGALSVTSVKVNSRGDHSVKDTSEPVNGALLKICETRSHRSAAIRASSADTRPGALEHNAERL